LGAAAMSEPNVGSDLGSISCRARRDGNDWVINGNKYWCTFADGADYIMLVARHLRSTRPPAQACRAVVLPDRKAARHAAARREGRADSQDRLFRLEDLGTRLRRLPPARLGPDRRGRPRLLLHLRRAGTRPRPHAARAIGLARGALEDATAYAKERQQFGQAIGDFQNTRFRLAAWRPRSRRRAS